MATEFNIRNKAICLFLLVSFAGCFSSACLNPFAPEEGDLSGDLWDPQVTVGGLLRNFETSYSLRDSLRYSDLLAEEFEFRFFDVNNARYDQWYRDTELRATAGMMRAVDRLDLRWGAIPASLDTFAQQDTTIEFNVNFSLTVGDYSPLFGTARFRARTQEDGLFRLVMWQDDY